MNDSAYRLTSAEFDALVLRRQRAWRAGSGMGPFPLREEIRAEEGVEIVEVASPIPTLKRGARVRFNGTIHPRVPFGATGVVTGQDRDRWIADFTVGQKVERVTLWRSELEVLGG